MPGKKQITSLQNRVFGKEKEYNVLDVYHRIMTIYGYIDFDVFKEMDAGLVDELMNRIIKDNETPNPSKPGGMGRGSR